MVTDRRTEDPTVVRDPDATQPVVDDDDLTVVRRDDEPTVVRRDDDDTEPLIRPR